jgi:hypothetical protein
VLCHFLGCSGRKFSHLATKSESELMLLAVITPCLLLLHCSMAPKWMQRAVIQCQTRSW